MEVFIRAIPFATYAAYKLTVAGEFKALPLSIIYINMILVKNETSDLFNKGFIFCF